MAEIIAIDVDEWSGEAPSQTSARALAALESGGVVFFPQLAFKPYEVDALFGADTIIAAAKNISYDANVRKLSGVASGSHAAEALSVALAHYAVLSRSLVLGLFERYAGSLTFGRTSFRPTEIAGRKTSWRKDDTRLHIDSFPATPVHGKRILRVFSNVDPERRPRSWRTGEPFEKVAARFLPAMSAPLPGSSMLLHRLGITKTPRSRYDHYMLKLHDAMKADEAYQAQVEQSAFDFPAGSTWIVYTDQVSHAAMKGRGAFEQTFYLPVEAMARPETSPLHTLERLLKQRLT